MISNTTSIQVKIFNSAQELGQHAGEAASLYIRSAIEKKGQANIIMATGTAQYATLEYLIHDETIDWSKVIMFHLDEYIGIDEHHKASFRKFLTDRFLIQVSPLKKTHLINGLNAVTDELLLLNKAISLHPIDVALIGIGENGHLAFNDPPADFETRSPYIKVRLDQACREQQVREGWFDSLNQVPTEAISMSIHHILQSNTIIASVPELRKALPVKHTIHQPVHPMYPSTALQLHTHCELFLDKESSGLL